MSETTSWHDIELIFKIQSKPVKLISVKIPIDFAAIESLISFNRIVMFNFELTKLKQILRFVENLNLMAMLSL